MHTKTYLNKFSTKLQNLLINYKYSRNILASVKLPNNYRGGKLKESLHSSCLTNLDHDIIGYISSK